MSLSVLPFVQRRLGLALRARVAGDDAPARAHQIWGAEGERWFTPEDPIWRVHADASMFPGGLAALLLQSLHPLAMAGVAGHSGYKGDPWGRLQRTSHYLAVTTFGTVEDASDLDRGGALGAPPRARQGRARSPVRRRRPAPAALGARRRDQLLPRGLPGLRRHTADPGGGRPVRRTDSTVRRAPRRHRPADDRRGTGRACWRRTARSWRAPPRPARRPGSCCSTLRCRSSSGRAMR